MKSNLLYEVLDTVTADIQDQPQIVIERMKTTTSSCSKHDRGDDCGIGMTCRSDGCFQMYKYYKNWKDIADRGPVTLRGKIVAGENGKTHLEASIVYNRIWRWLVTLLCVAGVLAGAWILKEELLRVESIIDKLFYAAGIVLVLVVLLWDVHHAKKKRHAECEMYKAALLECVEAVEQQEEYGEKTVCGQA